MKKRFRLIFFIIMCLLLLNTGGVISYAEEGDSNDVIGTGSGAEEGQGFKMCGAAPLIVEKVWKPDSSGDYGPYYNNEDKDVTIKAELNFKLEYDGKTLNFKHSASAKTRLIDAYDDNGNSVKKRLASIDLDTGSMIEEYLDGSGQTGYMVEPVMTIKDDTGEYSVQYPIRYFRVRPKTGDFYFFRIKIYKSSEEVHTPPPGAGEDIKWCGKLEQPPENAVEIQREIKGTFSVSEVETLDDYKKEVTMESTLLGPPRLMLKSSFDKNSMKTSSYEGPTKYDSLKITVTNTYDPKSFAIKFDPNGGYWNDTTTDTAIKEDIYKNNTKIKLPEAPKRNGYTFLYWEGSIHYPGDTYIVKGPHTFKAIWKKDEPPKPVEKYYTIKVDPNGGNWDGDTGIKTYSVKENEIFKLNEAPKKEGYTFLYWKGSEYKPGDEYKVVEDHTFTAEWKKDEVKPEPKEPEKQEPENKEPEKKNPVVVKEAPKTGDSTEFMMYVGLAGLMSMIVLLIIKQQKNFEL